jgi:ABC-2 type transport system permease protein
MNALTMLIRREFWENRSLWIAPLVVAGVVLLASATGGVHIQGEDDGPFQNEFAELGAVLAEPQIAYLGTMAAFTIFQFIVIGFVVFFYLLDSLLGERKDRSILFWKSLPISDSQVVASKAITALVLAPIIALLVSAATQLLFGVIWSIRGSGDTGLLSFDGSAWLQLQVGSLLLAGATIVWYLPLAGYFMLISVWVRKNAFLWALLPLIGVMITERLFLGTVHFVRFLGDRFIGVYVVMAKDNDHLEFHSALGFFAGRVGRVFAEPKTWIGIVVAAAMYYAVVRIRRYRDDS